MAILALLSAAGLFLFDLSGPRRAGRLLACLGAGALGLALGSLPGPLANHAASGELVWVSSNGGINFWFGHNPAARGTFVAPGPEWGSIGSQRATSLQIASQDTGRPLAEVEASRYWTRRGLGWIAANPLAELQLAGRKLAACLANFEYGIQYLPAAVRGSAPGLWIAPLPFVLLLLVGGLGWFELRGARGMLLGWIAAGVLGAILYFTYSRFRLTFAIAWMPFAAAGTLAILRAWKQRQWPRRAGLVLGVTLAGIALYPFEGKFPRQLVSHGEVDLARALISSGKRDRAERVLERALARVPTEVSAMVELARLARGRSEDARALELLERATLVPVAYPARERELALLLSSARDPEVRDLPAARDLLERWLVEFPAQTPLRARQLVLYAGVQIQLAQPGTSDRARAALEEALAFDPETPGARELGQRLGLR